MSDLDQLWRSTARQNRTVVDSIKHLSYIGCAPASRRALLYASFIRYHHRPHALRGQVNLLVRAAEAQHASANCGNCANPKSAPEMGIEPIGGSHVANCGNCANLAWRACSLLPSPGGAVEREGQQKMQEMQKIQKWCGFNGLAGCRPACKN